MDMWWLKMTDEIGSVFWNDSDGWRGWTVDDKGYYFNDYPQKDLLELINFLMERRS